MASTYLSRSVTTTGNQRTFTISAWVKRSKLGSVQYIVSAKNVGETTLYFRAQDDLQLELYDGNNYYLRTTRLFRDTNAWYHIVAIWDSIRPTSSDRMRLYVNGVQETSFSAAVYPPQNYDSYMNQSGETNYVGNYHSGSSSYYDGSMSHVHLIDGNDYNPSYFGETDSTTGEWKIKTDVSVTYGTNGFFILKDGNSVTDQSGNGNNFTVAGGTLTNTEDNPSNVFATWNPLSCGSGTEFQYGNTRARKDTAGYISVLGTIGFGSGKYYWENYRHGGGDQNIGICLAEKDGTTHSSVDTGRVAWGSSTVYIGSDTGISGGNVSTGTTYGDTDIIGCSLDTENGVMKFYKNGSLVTTITDSNLEFTNKQYIPCWQGANGGEVRSNFGNGYFGTTAVSSAGTNASGNGIFEYDVPTGFTALSTKGLNT